jgi:anti-sigma factor RsiW
VTEGRWRISVTAPDWGQDHLSLDAIVAYVDDELAHGPHLRATRHLAQCRECAAQVVAQGQARSALRMAGGPSLPTSLLSSLRSIPQDTELPPQADLAVTADGQLVSVLRPERLAPLPPETPQASEQADLAVLADAPPAGTDHRDHHGRRPQRRLRVGTGVAVSGLALGAIALAMPSAVAPQTPVPAATNGVLGDGPVLGGPGSVLGGSTSSVVDAQLRLQAAPTASRAGRGAAPTLAPAFEQLDAIPGSFYGLP